MSTEILLARANILHAIRSHFEDASGKHYALEICTPGILPQQESYFEVIRLAGYDKKPWARETGLAHQSDMNMRYSALKYKSDMYQVSHCFRAETEDRAHLRDFQMLEIIRINRSYQEISL